MSKIVVGAGTAQMLEFPLKAGPNSIGRGDHNEIQISDHSISGTHCQIILQDGLATIRDLGSTNGTFVDGAQVQEAPLQNGQSFRLGTVDVCFYASDSQPAATVETPASAPRKLSLAGHSSSAPSLVVAAPAAPGVTAAPVSLATSVPRAGGLRIAGGHTAAAATEAAPPSNDPPAPDLSNAPRFCRFHPKSAARYLCPKCNRPFCELCVSTRPAPGGATIRTCRSCGVECLPLQVQGSGPVRERGFFGQLPGAFLYPFRGTGLLILIIATIVFAALDFISGPFTILLTMAVLGYVFLFMQNIVHATAAEEKEMPGLPDFDGLFGAFFTLVGTVIMSFGPAIGLLIAKATNPDTIPTAAVTAGVVFGCVYFPMAFLATAMKDTALASNPLIVVPAIIKVPLEYLVTVILLGGIFGVRALGDYFSSEAGDVAFSTRSVSTMFGAFGFQALWAFISMYLLTITMRILGLLYVTKKGKLAWF
jgi:hypothetical protein